MCAFYFVVASFFWLQQNLDLCRSGEASIRKHHRRMSSSKQIPLILIMIEVDICGKMICWSVVMIWGVFGTTSTIVEATGVTWHKRHLCFTSTSRKRSGTWSSSFKTARIWRRSFKKDRVLLCTKNATKIVGHCQKYSLGTTVDPWSFVSPFSCQRVRIWRALCWGFIWDFELGLSKFSLWGLHGPQRVFLPGLGSKCEVERFLADVLKSRQDRRTSQLDA